MDTQAETEIEATAGADVVGLVAVGEQLPDFELLDHAGNLRRHSQLVGGDPTVVQFYRGWWCPKEQAFFRRLLGLQEDAEVAYARILSISIDPPPSAPRFARVSERAGRFSPTRSATFRQS